MNLSALEILYFRRSLHPPTNIIDCLVFTCPYALDQFLDSSWIPAPQIDSTSRWKGVDTPFKVLTECSIEVVSRIIM